MITKNDLDLALNNFRELSNCELYESVKDGSAEISMSDHCNYVLDIRTRNGQNFTFVRHNDGTYTGSVFLMPTTQAPDWLANLLEKCRISVSKERCEEYTKALEEMSERTKKANDGSCGQTNEEKGC